VNTLEHGQRLVYNPAPVHYDRREHRWPGYLPNLEGTLPYPRWYNEKLSMYPPSSQTTLDLDFHARVDALQGSPDFAAHRDLHLELILASDEVYVTPRPPARRRDILALYFWVCHLDPGDEETVSLVPKVWLVPPEHLETVAAHGLLAILETEAGLTPGLTLEDLF
jgi:hypothetical protein